MDSAESTVFIIYLFPDARQNRKAGAKKLTVFEKIHSLTLAKVPIRTNRIRRKAVHYIL
jgi:hypothetical protein